MKKADKETYPEYEWAKHGDKGKFRNVPLDKINIDYSYQRDEVSKKNTAITARNFDWIACGCCIAMERPNGALFLVDGQQRYLAAKHRGDIKELPCLIFRSDGREHEANAFISINIRRSVVGSVDKFNAASNASLEPEKTIALWLSTLGLKVTRDSKDMKGVDFPSALVRPWKTDSRACQHAIITQRSINGMEPLNSNVHKGLWWLLHNNIDVNPHINKLISMGGRVGIQRSIKSLEIELGEKAGERLCGIAILRMINYKRKTTKIKIPEKN